MNKCFECNYNINQIYCNTCNNSKFLCIQCNKTKHFQNPDTKKDHDFFMICEECEEDQRELYCKECEQYFCKNCDRFIHKKGTRALHLRKQIDVQQEMFKMMTNVIYIQIQMKKDGGYDREKLRSFVKEIKIDLDIQFKYTIFLSNLDIELDFEDGEELVISDIKGMSLRDYLMLNFGKDIFLNFVVLFKKKYKEDEVIENELSESYPFCQIHFNINPFKFVNKDLRATSGKKGHAQKKKLSRLDSKEGNRSIGDTMESCAVTKPNTRLSSYFTRDELLMINSGKVNVSKKVEKDIRERRNMLNLKLNGSTTTIDALKMSASQISKNEDFPKFPIFTVFNDIYTDSMISPSISFNIQKEMTNFCKKGKIQVDYNVFLNHMMKVLDMPESSVRNILLRAADHNILLITMRQVTQHHMLNFVSLKLEILSLENLYWVVKSLLIDRVTPVQNTIISRIKQSFGLKFKGKTWKYILNEMYSYILFSKEQEEFSPFKSAQISEPWKKDLTLNYSQNPFVQGQKVYILGLESMKDLKPEDSVDIDSGDQVWIEFKNYLDEIFDQDLIFFNDSVKENQELTKPPNPILNEPFYKKDASEDVVKSETMDGEKTISRYQSLAVDSQYSEQQSARRSVFTLNSGNNPQNQGKAIPGGRHGLTQFIRHFGPERYRKFSYGKLSKLVQKAIDLKLLKYYKTFLVKNDENNEDSEVVDEKLKEVDKDEKIKIIREKLMECLIEKDNYIPLAQLKRYLFKKIDFKLDLGKLGFEKLKDLLATFPEINVESLGDNHFYLQLREEDYQKMKQKFPKKKKKKKIKEFKPILADLSNDSITDQKKSPQKNPNYAFPKKNPNNNFSFQNLLEKNHGNFSINNFSAINPSLKNSLLFESKKQFKNFKDNCSLGDFKLDQVNLNNLNQNNNHSWNGGIGNYPQNLNNGFSLEHKRSNVRTLTCLEGYLNKVLRLIEEIVSQHKFGMEMNLLYKMLTQKLKVDHFNPRIFKCENFNIFLINHAESSVDIQLTRNKRTGVACLMIYPKNFRFGFKDNNHGHTRSRKSSKTLKITSEPFQKGNAVPSPMVNQKVLNQSIRVEPNNNNSHNKKSLRENPNSWFNVINTSFLDDLPSLNSHRRSLSMIHPYVNEEDNQAGNKKSTKTSITRNNSYQYNPNHPNNTSNHEIREYIDFLNVMLADNKKSFNNTFDDEKLQLTFLSAGMENSEHSVLTIPSEKSNHSRVMSYEKRRLQVVAEQAKERISGEKNSGGNGKEFLLNLQKMNDQILDYEKQRKSLSMDKKDDVHRQPKIKENFKVGYRGGSLRGVDLDKLKIFVDDKNGN